MPGENRTIESLTRKNSLFLSAAAQNNHEALLPIYKWITGLLFVIGDRAKYRHRTAELCSDPDYQAEVARLVSVADLGISGMKVEEEKLPDMAARMYTVLGKFFKSEGIASEAFDDQLPPKRPQMSLLHRWVIEKCRSARTRNHRVRWRTSNSSGRWFTP